jgi:hypothetical protein
MDKQSSFLSTSPSSGSSQNDFDFLVGSWKIRNRKLKTRLKGEDEWTEFEASGEMHKILRGLGNIDNFITTVDEKPFEGMSLRLFNPVTRLWSIYWSSSNTGVLEVPVVGSFENEMGRFHTNDVFEGKEILVAFQWDITDPNKPVWSQAFSADGGETWEWNWYMYFSRV